MADILIIFGASLIATLLSVMSGGGASIISLPIFLWTGMSLPLAVATHKVCAAFWTPISAYNYLKGKKIDWWFLFLFAGLGLIGAYFGVKFVISFDQVLLKKIIGGIIVFFAVFTFFKKDLGLKEMVVKSKIKRLSSYPAALIMGFYESIIGSGNGIAFAILTFYSRGFDFVSALGYYFGVAFFWVTFAAIIYVWDGYFDLGIMLAAILGSVIGSYIGSKYAAYKGDRFIKNIFVIVGVLLGLKLVLNI